MRMIPYAEWALQGLLRSESRAICMLALKSAVEVYVSPHGSPRFLLDQHFFHFVLVQLKAQTGTSWDDEAAVFKL